MLHFVDGNLFESPAQTLVNTVNTAGAMGKGLAKEYKRIFPNMFKEYQQLCESGSMDIGKLWLYQTKNKWVLNFPTKKHWRQPSKIEFIEKGLQTFVGMYDRARITSIAFPQLGCGNGELDWADVKPMMAEYLSELPVDVYIYEVYRPVLPEHRSLNRMREWLMSEPLTYPFTEFRADLQKAISDIRNFVDSGGVKFEVTYDDNAIHIKTAEGMDRVPWISDDTESGWLQLWQFVRNKGVCTAKDVSNIGLPQPERIIALLLALPYLRPLKLLREEQLSAVQLTPGDNQVSLFSGPPANIKPIRL